MGARVARVQWRVVGSDVLWLRYVGAPVMVAPRAGIPQHREAVTLMMRNRLMLVVTTSIMLEHRVNHSDWSDGAAAVGAVASRTADSVLERDRLRICRWRFVCVSATRV